MSVPTDEEGISVAILLGACSRRVVGKAMADQLRTELTHDALIRLRRTADRYQVVPHAARVTCSMSRAGNCLDTAMAESCFATLKRELIDRQGWRSPPRRSALGDLSPARSPWCRNRWHGRTTD